MSAAGEHLVTCPHCGGLIVVAARDMNCRIFRHAVFKATLEPISPHAPRAVCESLVAAGTVLGCGKPFRITPANVAVACDYI